jgi:hypothetical protein
MKGNILLELAICLLGAMLFCVDIDARRAKR